MALHNNDGKGYKNISDLIEAIRKIVPQFTATELRNMVTEMHNCGYVFNDREKENVTVIICDKGNMGYYFGLEGIQS